MTVDRERIEAAARAYATVRGYEQVTVSDRQVMADVLAAMDAGEGPLREQIQRVLFDEWEEATEYDNAFFVRTADAVTAIVADAMHARIGERDAAIEERNRLRDALIAIRTMPLEPTAGALIAAIAIAEHALDR